MRRTLAGCEFGVCYDFKIDDIHNKIFYDKTCLVVKDPLFVFTISVKSMIPVLAGILIIGLVYISNVAESIFEWITNFAGKGIKEIIKITLKEIVTRISNSQNEKLCDSLCCFLQQMIVKQIEKMKIYDDKLSNLITHLLQLAVPKDFSRSAEMINNLFKNKVNFGMKFDSFIDQETLAPYFLKIGFLLMSGFSSFLLNFHFHRQAIKYDSKKVSAEYDKKQNAEEILEQNKRFIKIE